MESLVRITRIEREAFYQNLIEQSERKQARVQEPQLPLLKLSKYLAERSVTAPAVEVPECVTCGVCCAYPLFVPVSLKDSERLNEMVELTLADGKTEIAVDRILPRDPGTGHCANLAGTLGEQIGCTIYSDRPKVCHDFEAGSDRCHEYRRIYGLEPRLSQMEIISALCRIESIEKKQRIVDARVVHAETISHFSFSVHELAAAASESVQLKIVVFLEDDEAPHEIHRFDPAREIWFESDFLSLNLAEAKELVASRTTQELI